MHERKIKFLTYYRSLSIIKFLSQKYETSLMNQIEMSCSEKTPIDFTSRNYECF